MSNLIPITLSIALGCAASGSVLACSCLPEPPSTGRLQDMDPILSKGLRQRLQSPNVFVGVPAAFEATPNTAKPFLQAVVLSTLEPIAGRLPIHNTVYNAFLSCPATLVPGQKYIFFADPDMTVNQCGVRPYSKQQADWVRREIPQASLDRVQGQ